MKPQTPKHFVIQLGSLITLYVALTSLITLLFGIININFPDELSYYSTLESARESMRVSIAFLVIFFPAYLVLTRVNNQTRRTEEGGEYTTLARWLVYLSLLVGGGILLGDLVTILIYFLNGEITTRFILKALTLFVVVGLALYYYSLDVRGYFKDHEARSKQFAGLASLLVLGALVFGFMHIETPAEVRELRLDTQQVTDLQDMQWRIEEYYRTENTLPETLTDAYVVAANVPTAPAGRESYRYEVTGEMTYELCARFAEPTHDESAMFAPRFDKNYSWEHEAGDWCFKREIIEPTLP